MALSNDEAKKLMRSISDEFMKAARAFDEDGVNCVGITNSDVDWRDPAVYVGTKGPLTDALKQEVTEHAEKTLGRKTQKGELLFQHNGPINAYTSG